MKLKALAIALSALSVNSFAAGLAPTGNFDITYRMAGSSAMDNHLFYTVLKNICGTNISVLNPPSTSSTPHKLGNYFGVACTAKTTAQDADIDSNVSGKNILWLKRSAGGSAYGVNTLTTAAPSAFAQLDPTTCTANGTYTPPTVILGGASVDAYTCTNGSGTFTQDGGIADIHPSGFFGSNTPAGFSDVVAGDVSTYLGSPKGSFGAIFGIVVSKNLRDALQLAQYGANCVNNETEACMPSMSRTALASIFTASNNNWNQFYLSSGPNAGTQLTAVAGVSPPASTNIRVCRRANGSGTQAILNTFLLKSPHSSAALSPAAGNTANIVQGSGSSDVINCIKSWNNGASASIATDLGTGTVTVNSTNAVGWAIGVSGLEKADPTMRFIKVDGFAPTAKNVHAGTYTFYAEGVFTQRVDAYAPSVAQQGLFNTIKTQASKATEVKITNDELVGAGFGAAYLAISTVAGNTPDAIFNANNPVVAWTFGTANTNDFRQEVINTTVRSVTQMGN